MSMHNSDISGNSPEDFDTGPLSWVLDEISEALQRSRAALFEAVEKGADAGTTLLNHANAYLNQAHGALQIVDVQGGDLITETAGQVLHAMMEGRLPLTSGNAGLIGNIYQALTEYLEDLLAGAKQRPLLLFPYYSDMKQALDASRIHPADLLFPNFASRLQSLSASSDAVASGAGDAVDYGVLRPRFERELLPVLKNAVLPAGMEELESLGDIIAEIEKAQTDSKLRDFWWVMRGFAEMAHAGQFTNTLYVKLVFARLNLQIRQLAARSDFMSERLLKEALFMLASAKEPTSLMKEIRSAYQIEGQVPADFEKRRYGKIDPEMLDAARQEIVQAKKWWVQASAGNRQALKEFEQSIGRLTEASSALQLPALAQVFLTVGSVLADGDATGSNERLALEMASSLLFAENAFEQIRLLPADFAQKAETLQNRLKLAHSGQDMADSDAAVMLPETQQRNVMKLAAEMGANLRQAERILDEYFADLSQAEMLADVKPILQQIEGGLSLVEQDDARQAVTHAMETVERLHENGEQVGEKTLQAIAHNLSALGFFLEMLAQHPDSVKGRFSFDENTGIFHARVVEAGDVRSTSFMYAEDDVEAARNELEVVLGKESVRGKERPAVVSAPAGEGSEEIEEEDLLDIFISEAEDALEYISSTAADLKGLPEDREHFPTLRRSFHTMKGSSRMVGLTDFSEASASVEQVMNLWLSEARDGTPDLYALLGKAAGELGAWVAELKARGGSERTSQAIAEAAERVKRGGGFHFEEAPSKSAERPSDATGAEAGQEEPPLHADDSIVLEEGLPADLALDDLSYPAEDSGGTIELIALPPIQEFFPDQANVAGLPATAPESPDDDVKRIGDLQISLPLLNIYLAEAGQLIGYLAQEFTEWRQEPERPVADEAMHAAHSLAGCSATVGFISIHDVAYGLETFLQMLDERRIWMTADEFAVLQQCVEALKEMLAQVMRDEMPSSHPELLQRLSEMRPHFAQNAASRDASVEERQAEEVLAQNAPVFIQAEEPVLAVLEKRIDVPEHESGAAHKDSLDPDLLPVFLEEGRDLLPQVGQALRAWQKTPDDFSIASRILRHLHTTKGSARMAGAMGLGQHIHLLESRIENILRTKSVTPQVLEDLLSRHDHSMQLFSLLEDTAHSGSPVFGLADSMYEAGDSSDGRAAASPGTGVAPPVAPRVRVRADILDRLVNQAGEVSIARSKIENEIESLRHSMSDLTENLARLRHQLREVEIQAETQIASRLAQTGEREFDPLEFDRFSRLQELTRMMTESVDDISSIQEGLVRTVDGATHDLETQSRLTRVLQEDLMQVRMVPFSSIAERLYQVTRQTAKETGKRVNLDIHGASVEVDRGVLEKMMGPLEHLLRNAIVHGIEERSERKNGSKDETGELVLEVRHEGNEVVMRFSDDGRGLNFEKIQERAESAGLIAPGKGMTEAQLKELVFQPGFTTAGEITELAGRGVGLDVVRAEVAALGGRVALDSSAGSGTSFVINLPLTLAVTSVVLLSTGGNTYAVPSILVEQVQHFRSDALLDAYQAGSVAWMNEKVALHFLSALLGDTRATPMIQQYTPVVILRSGTDRVALHVDAILGNKEVVVKNVGPQLARMVGIAGATVLGSGEIVLILNPVPLAQRRAAEGRQVPAPAPAIMESQPDVQEIGFGQIKALAPAGEGPREQPGLRKKNIVMVVDDSLTVRRVTQRFLSREGYQVILAKDGIDALEQLQNVTPDIMLVDIEMPRMDGFDLTRNVRSDARLRSVPIIMITSRSAAKHRNYAMELGVNEYYGKPFQEEELLKSINSFMRKEAATS